VQHCRSVAVSADWPSGVSRNESFSVELGEHIEALDVNLLICGPDCAVAVDAQQFRAERLLPSADRARRKQRMNARYRSRTSPRALAP
jgi:hypothetical protein